MQIILKYTIIVWVIILNKNINCMNSFKKILITTLIFNIFPYFSFAQNPQNDCDIFANQMYSQKWKKANGFDIVNELWGVETNFSAWFLTPAQQLEIMDTDSLNTALLNLKKYCCNHSKYTWWPSNLDQVCIDDSKFFEENSPNSPYLFDHLFDIIMRRLSWLKWDEDIYSKLNMTTDKKWTERRSRINSQAENTDWANPQVIINEYSKFRTPSELGLGYNINNSIHNAFLGLSSNNFLEYVSGKWNSEESKQIAEAFKNYDKRTLYDRYNNACALTEFFYSFLTNGKNPYDKAKYEIFQNECNRIVSEQISAEIEYTSLIIKRSSNLFLSNYINGYMSYLEKRSNTFKQTWKDSADKFFDVVRAIPMLISKCTIW